MSAEDLTLGRESCLAPGMAHKARNCTNATCAASGVCMEKNAGPVQLKDTQGARPQERVTDFSGKVDGGGYKASMDDPSKLPLWLVPVTFIKATAAVLAYGKRKYAANNWRKGMAWSEVYSALLRHLTAWQEGEENDAESGLSHLWHAACCLAFLIEYAAFRSLYGRFDDRFKRPTE